MKKIFLYLFVLLSSIVCLNAKEKTKLVFIAPFMADERLYENQINYFSKDFDITVIVVKDYNNINKASNFIYNTLKNKYKNTFDTDKFIMVGTSMGGIILMDFIENYKNKVLKVALLNTTFKQWNKEEKQAWEAYLQLVEKTKESDFVGMNDDIVKAMIYNITQDKKDLLYDMAKKLGKNTFVNQTKLLLSRPDYSNTLKQVNFPVLVIGADFDYYNNVDLHKEMFSLLPKGIGELLIVKNSAHFAVLDQPAEVNNALNKFFNK